MKEFHAAAQAAVDDDTGEEKYLEFSIAGQEFVAAKPSLGQIALVAGSFGDAGETEILAAIFGFLRGVLQDDGYRRLKALVADGTVPLELLFGGNEDNEIGIVEWLVQTSLDDDRPTQRSTVSSSSPRTGGPRSTGRSPGKGSIHSGSLPVAS